MNFSSAENQGAAPPGVPRARLRAHSRDRRRGCRNRDRACARSAEAAQRGLDVIDIRTAEEFAARPTAARHIPMPLLLADPGLLAPGRDILAGLCLGQAQPGGGARAAQTRATPCARWPAACRLWRPAVRFESKLPDVGTTIFTRDVAPRAARKAH